MGRNDTRIAALWLGLGMLCALAQACDKAEGSATREPASKRETSREGQPAVSLEVVAEGLGRITDIELVPGERQTFVVTNQDGQAQLIDLRSGKVVSSAAMVLELSVDTTVEMGLLGWAFHPEYAKNGRVFVHYNPKGKSLTRVVELALPKGDLGKQKPAEKRTLLELKQPYPNHNGGELAFGPDGKLYLGLGDGGAAGDPHHNGQDLGTELGKILRFDVDAPDLVPRDNPFVGRADARPLIFAYGLRNPWKFAFLSEAQLVVADVGQDKYEELDLVRAGDNLGWNVREGFHCFKPPTGCATQGFVDPVFEYTHAQGNSITGGAVYEGRALSSLRGRYVFADYGSGRFWALKLPATPGTRVQADVIGVFGINPTSFGRDADGELYVSDYSTGRLFRITAP